MLNILLAGVGGQGTVLAAKLLAQAAHERNWDVRTAETIGMAQRGGSVVSHVRIGDCGEHPASALLQKGTADLIVAFEPAEAARALPYLAPYGMLVSATTPVQPVTVALSGKTYNAARITAALAVTLGTRFAPVDDAALCAQAGTRRVLNTVLLASALKRSDIPFCAEDLCNAIRACVKPAYVDMNLRAVSLV